MSHTGEVVPMEGATGGPLSDSDDSHSKYNITLREADIAQISMALKESFRDELRAEMATLVKGIVDGVLTGVNEKMQSMEKEVKSLKKENASLKFRVQKLESAAEVAEQYSRRNCLRVSGIGETVTENTDGIILKMAEAIDAGITLNEVDRSHRVGKPKAGKSRDIIVKLSTFRVRQRLYTARKKTENTWLRRRFHQ